MATVTVIPVPVDVTVTLSKREALVVAGLLDFVTPGMVEVRRANEDWIYDLITGLQDFAGFGA